MKVKINNKKKMFVLLLFGLAIISKGVGDSIFVKIEENSVFNLVKYIFLLGAILIMMTMKRRNFFKKEFNILMMCYFCIFFISLFYSILNFKFTFRTVKEFIFILIPIIFAYFSFNVFEEKDIENMAKFSAIVYAISYFIEIRDSFSIPYVIESIKHFSILGGQNSFKYDALESNAFSDVMMSLFCFFAYYNKKNKIWMWFTFILVLLMNKRLIIVFALIIMLLVYSPMFKEICNHQFKRNISLLNSIVFLFAPYIILRLTNQNVENMILYKYNINLYDFWMGRDSMVRNIINNGFQSFGLGSTFIFRNNHLLEIECLKFYFETSILGWGIISYSYWRVTNNIFYLLIVMLYVFLNICTSTSIITGAFAWIFYLYLMALVAYEKNGTEN